MSIRDAHTIFLVGIKGVGMTGLAQILQSQRKNVRGSDTEEKFFTDAVLQRAGIPYVEQFTAENITDDIDLVIHSAAYGSDHPELQAARTKGIPVQAYQEALGELSRNMDTIAVTGSHGKTTTTALCGVLHTAIGSDPTVLVGSEVFEFNGNARVGKGREFILEADEYKKKVLDLTYTTLVITNIDYDHPDVYASAKEYSTMFQEAVDRLPVEGVLVTNMHDVESNELSTPKTIQHRTIGRDATAWLSAKNIEEKNGTTQAEIYHNDTKLLDIQTSLIGEFNIDNILAALATLSIEEIQSNKEVVEEALQQFTGTRRRFERIGESKSGALLFDDYAHHPTEIRATLKAARQRYPNKTIWCVFHAHTYSRTEAFLDEFATAFEDADHVIIPDIYSSAREKEGKVRGKELAEAIGKHHDSVQHMATFDEITAHLEQLIDNDDIVIAMGAGDVWHVATTLAVEKA